MCVCVTQVCLVPSEVRRVLTLELRVVVSCHVSCGNQVLVLCKSTCSSQLSHLSSSLSLLITQLCSSFFKHIFIFFCVCTYVGGVYVYVWVQYLQRPKEATDSPRTGVTGCCELPNMDAGN